MARSLSKRSGKLDSNRCCRSSAFCEIPIRTSPFGVYNSTGNTAFPIQTRICHQESVMPRRAQACAAAIFLCAVTLTLAAQSVYPTGTTIYDPNRAWNGYTVLSPLDTQAVIVIDMNGNVVKQWDGYVNSAGGPARIFPNGVVMAANGTNPPRQESLELIQRDFDGHVLWRFDHNQQIQTRGGTVWSARQHHDWQREDFPAGYYSPGVTPATEGSKTLILTHTNHSRPNVADAPLEDDRLIEVSCERRHRLGMGRERSHRRIRLLRRREKCDQGRAGRQRRARQF